MPAQIYTDFIEQMRAKYMPMDMSQNMSGAAPAYGAGQTMARFAAGSPASAMGTRYTGRGQNNIVNPSEPAGVVHEGEMVVNAEDVKKAGGPKRIFSTVEKLKDAETRGFPGFKKGGYVRPGLRGYEAGSGGFAVGSQEEADYLESHPTVTGGRSASWAPGYSAANTPKPGESDYVAPGAPPDVIPPPAAGEDYAFTADNIADNNMSRLPTPPNPRRDLNALTYIPPSQASLDNLAYKPGAPKEMSDYYKPNKAYENATVTGMQGLQQQARTGGEAAELAAKTGRQEMRGSQAAGMSRLGQQLAQADITGGEALAATANQNRADAIASGKFEAGVVQTKADKAETALNGLISAGFQGQQLDLQKANFGLDVDKFNELNKQFEATNGLNLAQFQEDINRYGYQVAVQKIKDDWGMRLDEAKVMFDMAPTGAKDFAGIAKLVGLPESWVSTANFAQNRDKIIDSVAAVSAMAATSEFDDVAMQASLQNQYDMLGGQAVTGQTFADYARKTYDGYRRQLSPTWTAFQLMGEGGKNATMSALGFTDPSTFRFDNHSAGQESITAFMTAAVESGSMFQDPNNKNAWDLADNAFTRKYFPQHFTTAPGVVLKPGDAGYVAPERSIENKVSAESKYGSIIANGDDQSFVGATELINQGSALVPQITISKMAVAPGDLTSKMVNYGGKPYFAVRQEGNVSGDPSTVYKDADGNEFVAHAGVSTLVPKVVWDAMTGIHESGDTDKRSLAWLVVHGKNIALNKGASLLKNPTEIFSTGNSKVWKNSDGSAVGFNVIRNSNGHLSVAWYQISAEDLPKVYDADGKITLLSYSNAYKNGLVKTV